MYLQIILALIGAFFGAYLGVKASKKSVADSFTATQVAYAKTIRQTSMDCQQAVKRLRDTMGLSEVDAMRLYEETL